MEPMTGHQLTWTDATDDGTTYRPPVGRCECGRFSMIGPRDLVEDFHRYHRDFPDTSVHGLVGR